jgi:hypothetical protein
MHQVNVVSCLEENFVDEMNTWSKSKDKTRIQEETDGSILTSEHKNNAFLAPLLQSNFKKKKKKPNH